MRITTWGAPRALGALLVLSVLALMVAAGGSAARTPQAADTEGLIKPAWTPLGLRNDTTTVMVQVAGDPSALVEGNANRELSDAEKASIEGKSEGHAGRRREGRRAAGRHRPRRLPGCVQRPQGPHQPQQDGRGRERRERRCSEAARSGAARQYEGRQPDRCSRSLGRRQRLARREDQDRRDRHRHRLHARELRRPRHDCRLQRSQRR